jgi:transposase-like protein
LEPRRRAEQALVAVVQEAWVSGVSTRRVDRLVEQLGVTGLSKDQVSRLCKGLDKQVRVFRERPLTAFATRFGEVKPLQPPHVVLGSTPGRSLDC